jgi:hypothetical protein
MLPKASLGQNLRQRFICALDGPQQAPEEPLQPGGAIQITFLCCHQTIVILFALALNLGRQAVKALRGLFSARQRHVAHGTRDPSIAILKRMDSHKPQVGKTCFDDRVVLVVQVEPIQEISHFRIQQNRRGAS